LERKYYRQYDAYDKVIPRPEDFPPVYRVEQPKTKKEELSAQPQAVSVHNTAISLKADDIILLGLIVLLLMEEDKDYLTIGLLAAVFLCEYIF